MFLTGSHKLCEVGLMGLVLIPSSTLKTGLETEINRLKGKRGEFKVSTVYTCSKGEIRCSCKQKHVAQW